MIHQFHAEPGDPVKLLDILRQESHVVVRDRDINDRPCRIDSRQGLPDICHGIGILKLAAKLDALMAKKLNLFLCADRIRLHQRRTFFAAGHQHQNRQHNFEEPFHRSVGFSCFDAKVWGNSRGQKYSTAK